MDEAEAVERLRHGDVSGLEYLVRQHQVRAVRTAYLVTHDLALAEDVAQAAFLNAYEHIGQYDPRRPFGPWFFTSVLRAAIKAARGSGRHLPYEDADGEAGDALSEKGPDLEALGERAEMAREVWAAIQRLVPEQRAAVVARYYLGMSEAEVAAAVAAPLSTVKWRLHAARQRLRSLLGAATGEMGG